MNKIEWRDSNLSELCSFIRGVTFGKSDGKSNAFHDSIPVLRAGNIQEKLDIENDLLFIPKRLVQDEQILQSKDIVICLSSGSSHLVGKTAQLESDFLGTIGAFCGIIRPKNEAIAEFLKLFFKSAAYWKLRDSLADGASIQNLKFSKLENKKIKIPAKEQDAINFAHNLQSQLAHVETMRQAALKQKQAAKALQSSILREVFPWQAGASLPGGWRWEKLGKICKVYAGATPSRTNPDYWGGDIPWVKTGEINFNRINETQEFITEAGLNNSSARWIPKGAILIALYGQGLTRGRVAMLDIEATSNQACCALVCPDSLLNTYLFYFLYSRYDDIRNLSSGSSQDNLSGALIKNYSIPMPSTKEEQEKIANLFERKLQNFKELGKDFDAQLAAIETLPAAILREAFAFE